MKQATIPFSFPLVLLALACVSTSCQPKEAVTRSTEGVYDWAGSRRYAYVQGTDTLYYRSLGQGPDTVVLVHGFGPFPAAQWEPQALALADSSFVLIPDMLFFGQSNGADTALMPSDQADRLLDLLRHVGIKRFRLAGHSYGGLVALTLAERAGPSRVRSLFLLDPLNPFFPRTVLDSVERETGKPIEHVLVPSDPSDLPLLMRLTFSRNVPLPNALSQKILEPTFLLWGANDALIPLRSGVELQRAIPGSTLLIKPHNGHTPHLESPVAVIQLFKRWRRVNGAAH